VMWGVVTRAWAIKHLYRRGTRFLMAWLAATGWMIAGRSRAHVRSASSTTCCRPGRGRGGVGDPTGDRVFGLTIAGFAIVMFHNNIGLQATSLPVSMCGSTCR